MTTETQPTPPVSYTVQIQTSGTTHTLTLPAGTNLRQALLTAGYNPYGSISKMTNCGGRGLCATCGVRFEAGEPEPTHWHDRVAKAFGYPRLTCQITVQGDMVIRLMDDKVLWGQLLPGAKA